MRPVTESARSALPADSPGSSARAGPPRRCWRWSTGRPREGLGVREGLVEIDLGLGGRTARGGRAAGQGRQQRQRGGQDRRSGRSKERASSATVGSGRSVRIVAPMDGADPISARGLRAALLRGRGRLGGDRGGGEQLIGRTALELEQFVGRDRVARAAIASARMPNSTSLLAVGQRAAGEVVVGVARRAVLLEVVALIADLR